MSETLLPCRVCDENYPASRFAPSEVRRHAESPNRRPRCRACDNERYSMAYRRRKGLGPRLPPMFGPPFPSHGRQVKCPDCGYFHRRRSSSCRCVPCIDIGNARRRDEAHARRRKAIRDGDESIHWKQLGERDRWICHICSKRVLMKPGVAKTPRGATVDHIIPVSDDGKHEWDNVALAHRSCNLSRGAGGEVQLRLVG